MLVILVSRQCCSRGRIDKRCIDELVWLSLVIRATPSSVSYEKELCLRFLVDVVPRLQSVVEGILRFEGERHHTIISLAIDSRSEAVKLLHEDHLVQKTKSALLHWKPNEDREISHENRRFFLKRF